MTALLLRGLGSREGGGGLAGLVIERNFMFYRRFWFVILTGFVEPLFYLLAIGVGLGTLVPAVVGPGGQPVAYATFVAPAMLAASAMNGAVLESTINTFVKLRFWRTFDAMLATPLRPLDIAWGEIAFSQVRGSLYSTAFLVFAVALGTIPSWWGLLALPGAVLVGLAFGAVGTAAATWIRDWQDAELVQIAVLPMLLLSATFFPLDVYPAAVQPIVQLSPLYHGAALLRGLTLGVIEWSLIGHAAFLVAMAGVGAVVTARRFERLLKP